MTVTAYCGSVGAVDRLTKLSRVLIGPLGVFCCCTSRPNRVGSDGCGRTLTSRLFPQAPGLLAKRVSEPPPATAVATPVAPLTLTMAGADESHLAPGTGDTLLPSDRVAVAVRATLWPLSSGEGGVIAIDATTGA